MIEASFVRTLVRLVRLVRLDLPVPWFQLRRESDNDDVTSCLIMAAYVFTLALSLACGY